jgi:lysophospholipase L1-like esterase
MKRPRFFPTARAGYLPNWFLTGCLLMYCAVSLSAQSAQTPAALLTNAQVNQLCGRVTELMEAEGVAIADLQRASAPVIEATRQNCIQLQIQPGRASHTYTLLANLRAYLALADAVPKPFPFPEAAERQFTELRNDFTRLDSHFRALAETVDARLVSPDPANLTRYSEANSRLAVPNPAKPRVVFFGDSITDFWRLNEYFPESDYVNRGIAGQTTGEMLQRFQADVLNLHPQAVLVLAGTNDLARGIPVAAIENNYQMIATLAAANHIAMIFASVTPVSDYHKDQNPAYERTPSRPLARIRELNDWMQAYCSKQHCLYVDYFSSLVDGSGQLKADFGDDGLHPNAMGYRAMGPLASAAIEKTLAVTVDSAPKPRKRFFPSIIK